VNKALELVQHKKGGVYDLGKLRSATEQFCLLYLRVEMSNHYFFHVARCNYNNLTAGMTAK
jgi:hypothetical protein